MTVIFTLRCAALRNLDTKSGGYPPHRTNRCEPTETTVLSRDRFSGDRTRGAESDMFSGAIFFSLNLRAIYTSGKGPTRLNA